LQKRICLSRTNRHVETGKQARKRSNSRNIQAEYLRWYRQRGAADHDVSALNYPENSEIWENNSLPQPKESFGNVRRVESDIIAQYFLTGDVHPDDISHMARKSINRYDSMFFPPLLLINYTRINKIREGGSRRRKGSIFVTSNVEIDESRPQWGRVIGRACPDPLFIAHLTDKQWIEANTGDRGWTGVEESGAWKRR